MGHDDARLGTRDRLLGLLVPLLLVAVATVAVMRYHRVDQSSWQGVGFGMFATFEYTPARTVRATALVEGAEVRLAIPADLGDELERVLVAPGDPEADAFAEKLRSRSGAEFVELEVWGHEVDTTEEGLKLSFKVLRRVEAGEP